MNDNIDINYIRQAYKIVGLNDEEIEEQLTNYNRLILAKLISILSNHEILEKADVEDCKDISEFIDKYKNQFTIEMMDELIAYVDFLNTSIFRILSEEATEEQKVEIIKYLDEYKKAFQ
ncbi:MAG: hypothetical protein ACP5N7_07155 [Candidatus Pacearchaeota archaeon]